MVGGVVASLMNPVDRARRSTRDGSVPRFPSARAMREPSNSSSPSRTYDADASDALTWNGATAMTGSCSAARAVARRHADADMAPIAMRIVAASPPPIHAAADGFSRLITRVRDSTRSATTVSELDPTAAENVVAGATDDESVGEPVGVSAEGGVSRGGANLRSLTRSSATSGAGGRSSSLCIRISCQRPRCSAPA